MSQEVKIVDKDFKYCGVDYDYDSETDCESHGCDSICRCSTIINKEIKSVNVSELSEEIYDLYFPSDKSTKRHNKINSILYGAGKDLDIYCIDRILRVHKIWEDHNWDIQVMGGYYGEEIGDITMNTPVAKIVQKDIENVLSIEKSKDKIEYILNIEYGYILPELDNKSYEIIEVPKNLIVFGSDGHYKKIQTQDIEHYNDKNYSGIRGIVIKSGDKYRIIDGYHRIYATNNDKVIVIYGN